MLHLLWISEFLLSETQYNSKRIKDHSVLCYNGFIHAIASGPKGRSRSSRLKSVYPGRPLIQFSYSNISPIIENFSLKFRFIPKFILTWENVQKPEKPEKLIQALAFQLGNQVSYLELSRMTGIDKQTVERYINLLERAFVIFRLGSFNRNLRKELSKSRKIYFYDNGIRNAVIRNYAPLGLRSDTGALWENLPEYLPGA